MPGIIDLHVHLGATIGLKQSADFFTRENVEKDLKTYASYGVTTVLSMGTDKDLIFKIRDEQRAGRPTETRVYTAGQGFVFKGGYGGLAGVNHPISSVAEVDPMVAAQAANKVDIIKFWMDNEFGALPKEMPYPMAKAIIDSAHKRHLRAVAHIFYFKDAQQLANFGVDGFVHSVRDKPVDQALIDSMKRHGTWQVAATLSREASFVCETNADFANDPFFTRGVSPDVVKTLKTAQYQKTIRSSPRCKLYPGVLKTAESNLKAEANAGVKYGMGTDSGPPGRFPGYFAHWEMELMVQAGLTPMQVITAATRNAAEFLRAKDLGTLQASKWADLVVLEKNPLDNIKNTRTIDAVYIAGKKVD
jgi:imidazolonepropionase-like amidohydrolase